MENQLAALLGERHDAGRSRVLTPYHRDEAITVSKAAKLYGKSAGTIRTWASVHGLGRRVADGQWQLSRAACAMWLDGDKRALNLLLQGNREAPEVVAYFRRLGLGHLLPKGGANV